MRSVRIETAFPTVERQSALDPSVPPGAAPAPSGLWRRLAAFLLGITLGVSTIIIGQSAFHGDADLFGSADTPPTLRR